MLGDELHYYINGIPTIAIEDIQHRISDWLASGGKEDDPYIAQQVRYARNCYIKQNNIKQISDEQGVEIVKTYEPLGRYLISNQDTGVYTAIDNAIGDAWTEDFKTIFDAIKYLDGNNKVLE